MSSIKRFTDDMHKLGWTRARLASELGITTETLRVYTKDGPTKMAQYALAALVEGIRL